MKTTKMLDRLQDLLDPEKRKKKAKRKQLRALLKELKRRQRRLEERREQIGDKQKRQRLKREIEIIREQRRKGVRLCRKMGCH